ncbi:acyl-CoA N-acyltransferase [Lindgomyces ingoldianus]|uniref:Acyl-CoA N-acyltransferase n=1 Tax=Lindgomyces ingoldianus TaxID=673940 RepID=A0ACB6RAU9_9PLEO|nr:acyl-CoA N-acyltransferase [Lindgomyces ingoldianus]KAF2475475.1 acyl-CoA N-acyltransferase [Lindgomyces ingoldianus]
MATCDPFRSARLIYRAVHPEKDKDLFNAINDDRIGFQNSNAANIRLPGPADAEKFLKEIAEEVLLGAVICLPEAAAISSASASENIREATQQPLKKGKVVAKGNAGTPIGQIHLKAASRHMAHHRNTEIGIDILPQYQGKGYGSEAIQWALRFAFERAGLHRVTIRAFEWNDGAVRLYRKLGFKEEGKVRDELWFEGRWWDGVFFGMLEGEWRELRAKEGKEEIELL